MWSNVTEFIYLIFSILIPLGIGPFFFNIFYEK